MLSPKVEIIALSGTMEISAKTIEMKNSGIDVLDLCAGEPDLPTPSHIKLAAQKAINENKTKYTINSGLKELRVAVCNKFLKEYDVKYFPEEVIVSNGAKQALYNSLQTIISDGDEVLLSLPYFASYPHMIRLAGGIPKIINTQTKNDYKLIAEEFSNNITNRSKALILCNPNNPSGAVYSRYELESLINVAVANKLTIITDEIYEKLIYDSANFTSVATWGDKYRENLIIINGVSKAYSMTGWRIGYAVATEDKIAGMNKLQSHSTSNACTISQHAALAALTGPQDIVENYRKLFEERRNLVHNALTEIDAIKFIKPQGAFYFFINIEDAIKKYDHINTSKEFCLMLLNEGHVATVPGSVFGMEGYLRISYAKSKKELRKALARIKDTLTVFV